MPLKLLLKSLLAIFFLMASPISKAQDQNDVVIQQLFFFNSLQNDQTYFYYGNINLKTNEVIEGDISLNAYQNGKYHAILRTDEGCLYIPNTEIKDIVLVSNDKDSNEFTRFIPLEGKDKLFRELYVKDAENAIYDTMEKPFDGKIMSNIYVLENDNLVYIFNFWHSGPKADLLNYFEDRDQKKYKRRDFKNLEKLFAQL